jgi:hypothetical protein
MRKNAGWYPSVTILPLNPEDSTAQLLSIHPRRLVNLLSAVYFAHRCPQAWLLLEGNQSRIVKTKQNSNTCASRHYIIVQYFLISVITSCPYLVPSFALLTCPPRHVATYQSFYFWCLSAICHVGKIPAFVIFVWDMVSLCAWAGLYCDPSTYVSYIVGMIGICHYAWFVVGWDGGLLNFLTTLVSTCDPPNLHLLRSLENRLKPLCLDVFFFF